eukprot:TRINITY_DN2146_c0_g1_i3.p1 TRINITY_DN2146_c0_g1~~TRINITY_DN2146_c0_g1_i3.p1  ORF type:complete len:272 (+),score=36.26 TRINITY_DN2146_c0_g1_i3:127-942(+)
MANAQHSPPLLPDNPVIKSGSLGFKKHRKNNWARGFFILSSQGLNYTKMATSNSYPGTLSKKILDVDYLSCTDEPTTTIYPYEFMIKTLNKQYYFLAEDDTEKNKWLDSFKMATHQAKRIKCDPPLLPGQDPPSIVAFVNVKSGGQQGRSIMESLKICLGKDNVFDLSQGGPVVGLEQSYKNYGGDFKIMICGGDGTVGWVLQCLDDLHYPVVPQVGILPLGTGNDLARTLGWGPGYTSQELPPIIDLFYKATPVRIDRYFVFICFYQPMY